MLCPQISPWGVGLGTAGALAGAATYGAVWGTANAGAQLRGGPGMQGSVGDAMTWTLGGAAGGPIGGVIGRGAGAAARAIVARIPQSVVNGSRASALSGAFWVETVGISTSVSPALAARLFRQGVVGPGLHAAAQPVVASTSRQIVQSGGRIVSQSTIQTSRRLISQFDTATIDPQRTAAQFARAIAPHWVICETKGRFASELLNCKS